MVQDTFRRFADEKLKPDRRAHPPPQRRHPRGHHHGPRRDGRLRPVASPRSTAASRPAASPTTSRMVVATEELSRGSLGAGGSLITRPEILARALEAGGTEEQKQEWLPKLATAEVMNAVAVTEPDFGSDVAGVKVTATADRRRRRRRLRHQRREDLVHLRRPRRRADAAGPHRPRPHASATAACRCSSCPRTAATATASSSTRPTMDGPGRRQDGGPPDRHHRLPRHALLRDRPRGLVRARREPDRPRGGGKGRGFYYQMAGFENGRLQTAARAIGVMQAAYEAAPQVRRGPQGVRPADRRVPAHPGQARPHGRASSRPPASSPTTSPGSWPRARARSRRR